MPQRTCVACRRTGDQSTFVRLVRTPEGRIVVDEAGRAPGRGAYLCRQASCWQRGLAGALAGALKARPSEEDREALTRHAHRYAEGTPAAERPGDGA
jgi:predicted RNA-binding protein YlxR (DUF448 family)